MSEMEADHIKAWFDNGETIELFNYLIARTQELFPQMNLQNFLIKGNPSKIYSSYKNMIGDLLNKTQIKSLTSL